MLAVPSAGKKRLKPNRRHPREPLAVGSRLGRLVDHSTSLTRDRLLDGEGLR